MVDSGPAAEAMKTDNSHYEPFESAAQRTSWLTRRPTSLSSLPTLAIVDWPLIEPLRLVSLQTLGSSVHPSACLSACHSGRLPGAYPLMVVVVALLP